MKSGQLIEYDTRDIFLQTHTQNVVKKQFPDPFVIQLVLIVWQVECCRNILKAPEHLILPHIKLFKKTKRGMELVSQSHFLHEF